MYFTYRDGDAHHPDEDRAVGTLDDVEDGADTEDLTYVHADVKTEVQPESSIQEETDTVTDAGIQQPMEAIGQNTTATEVVEEHLHLAEEDHRAGD